MNDASDLGSHPPWGRPHLRGDSSKENYQDDLHTYLWGLALAVILTVLPFALVYWHVMAAFSLWMVIAIFALVQAIVHFRCFLHVRPALEYFDLALLLVFTVLILIMMAGGTVWILGNLHSRMY
jgi:cytochrome o ubiquinol oxidase subunit IV